MFSSSSHVSQQKKENDSKEDTSLMSSRMALNDHKAGMQNLDREKINQIIYDASKGSKFFENEKKKDEQVNQRIAEQQRKIARIAEFELAAAEKEADTIIQNLEKLRDLNRTIVHIDMDAFYAAVETRDNPSLQHKPMAVGSNSMLSTSNYIARRFGVRAAMPGFIGKKLCPQLVIIPPDFKKYTKVSRQVRSILVKYDENFCPMSLDEAYLDFTNHLQIRWCLPEEKRTVICRTCGNLDTTYCLCDPNLPRQQVNEPCSNEITTNAESSSESLVSCCDKSSGIKDNNAQAEQKTTTLELVKDSLNEEEEEKKKNFCSSCRRPFPDYKSLVFGFSVEDAVKEMRCRIEQRTQLTASAGIAPNTLLAKICSDKNKPNGQYSIPYSKEAIMEFMINLPIRKVCGIGKVTEKMLRALDIVTCSHLYKQRGLLNILYSETSFEHFMRVSLGIGSTRVERDSDRKSLSTEQTFTEISKPSELYEKCLQLSDTLASDLNNEGLMGRTISVKLKTVDFEVKSRSQTLVRHTDDKEMIYQVAIDLIKTEITACSPKPFRLRLMGVRISNLLPKNQCKKQESIDCFIKKNISAPNNVSLQSDQIPLATEQNQTISTNLAASKSQSESKSLPESPAGHYCPICNRKCPTNLRLFNAHIDKCLLSGENPRSSRKRSSPSLNNDSLTENTVAAAAQISTPLKTRKQQRGRPSKKMAQITFDKTNLLESITSRNEEDNLLLMDIAVKSSTEVVEEKEEELNVQHSPAFAGSSVFQFSVPETEEIGESTCTEMKQKTSLEIGADSDTEKIATFPCGVSGFDKDQQIRTSIVGQDRSVINSTLSLNCAKNHSVNVECLSPADRKTKSSHENALSDENYSTGEFPIDESDKGSASETDSLVPLKILENTSNNVDLSGKKIDKNDSGEKCPILEPLGVSKSTSQSPQAKVLSVPAKSLQEQNKKNWLEMLQKCSKNAAEVNNEKQENQETKIKKTGTKSELISPAKKKAPSNSAGKEKSKSTRNLLQYFHPTGAKPFNVMPEKNLDSVQATNLSEIKIKQEPLSPESPTKSFDIPKNLIPLPIKEENTFPLLSTDQVFNQSNCDSLKNSSNKIHPLEHKSVVLSKEELKSCQQPEMVMSDGTNKTQLNQCDRQSDQINVSNEFKEVGCCVKEKLIPKEEFFPPSDSADSKITAQQTKATISSTPQLSHDEQQTDDASDDKQRLHSDLSDKKMMVISMQHPLASPKCEEENESSSSQENFSQPFQVPNYEETEEELSCQSENEPETSSLQSVESANVNESQEDTDFVVGEIFTCPVCSKEVTASDMIAFNEHVDICLNQGVIHNILIEQGKEIKRTETMKRRADLLSPLSKGNKKKKSKIGTKSSKDHKTLTLDSFFS